MNESLAVIGTGYVGLVTGACFAAHGHRVISVDSDARKIALLKKAVVPFYEPGLEKIVRAEMKSGRLSFTVKAETALSESSIVFICVGTPPRHRGRLAHHPNMRSYFSVIGEIGRFLKHTKRATPLIIINKSTVPIGTAADAFTQLKKICPSALYAIVSNPEFLREGSAVEDVMRPDRIVIGTGDPEDNALVARLSKFFAPFLCQKIMTNWESAEMIKYASNGFLAAKISFINEIAALCENVGADVAVVTKGMGYDKRIGPHFLRAGLGYGGSCFPKDVRALQAMGANNEYSFKLLKSVIEVNNQQRDIACKKITRALRSQTPIGSVVCVLGLAFKPHTDDIRESASIAVIKKLARSVTSFRCYDPQARNNARRAFLGVKNVRICKTLVSAARGADALFLGTEWPEFVSADWKNVKYVMRGNRIIDGRNALNKRRLESLGFVYTGFGV